MRARPFSEERSRQCRFSELGEVLMEAGEREWDLQHLACTRLEEQHQRLTILHPINVHRELTTEPVIGKYAGPRREPLETIRRQRLTQRPGTFVMQTVQTVVERAARESRSQFRIPRGGRQPPVKPWLTRLLACWQQREADGEPLKHDGSHQPPDAQPDDTSAWRWPHLGKLADNIEQVTYRAARSGRSWSRRGVLIAG